MTEDQKKKTCVEHLEGKNSKIIIDKECIEPNSKKPPVMIIGFTGTGMIGTIITNELVNQLEMDPVGYVLSEDLPPITLFYDGELHHPFRIYHSDKYNLIVSMCEVPFLQGSYKDLARTLMSWALQIGVSEVVCLAGMADNTTLFREGPYEVFGAGMKEMVAKMKGFGIQAPPKGLIMGPEAAILNECLNDKLNALVLLTSANPQIPAPEGAVAIMEKLFYFFIIFKSLLFWN